MKDDPTGLGRVIRGKNGLITNIVEEKDASETERKIKEICKELVQKKGIRATGRALHVNRNTICNLLEDLANHAVEMTNYLVHNLDLKTYEVDEILTFVKKNKKNLSQKQISSLNQARQQLRHA